MNLKSYPYKSCIVASKIFFLLGILLRTLDMVVLKEFSLGLHFSKKYLTELIMSSGLLEYFVSVRFCKACLANILQKVLKEFSNSSSTIILSQIFAPFDYLRSSWCNLSCKYSIIGPNPCLKFSCKVRSLYSSQKILIFSCIV